jgi:acyl carrier protein phosphodiesterase
VNFLAHASVAVRTGSGGPDRVLGAVLPDLAPMAGCRPGPEPLGAGRLGPEVLDGIACHHLADRAFHADRAFTAGARRLRQAALAAGLAPGASRAVGHAGWELLLDGQLADRTQVLDAFSSALAAAPSAAGAFAPGDRPRWEALADHLATARWWRHYDDPQVVAEALHRRVRDRPRLAFGSDEVPVVVEVLGAELAEVAAVAGAVLDRVVHEVTRRGMASTTPSPGGGVGTRVGSAAPVTVPAGVRATSPSSPPR